MWDNNENKNNNMLEWKQERLKQKILSLDLNIKFGHLLVDITDKPTNKLTNETIKDVEWSPVHVWKHSVGEPISEVYKNYVVKHECPQT